MTGTLEAILADDYLGDVGALSIDETRLAEVRVGDDPVEFVLKTVVDHPGPDARRETSAALAAGAPREQLGQPGDVEAVRASLVTFEKKVSGLRRTLFDRIDALEAELTRRYKSGEASVDSLLG